MLSGDTSAPSNAGYVRAYEMDIKTAHKTASGNIITPAGRMSYPNLFRARRMKGATEQTEAKFGLTLLIPATANIKLLLDMCAAAAQEKWGQNAKKLRTPFLKTADKMDDLDEKLIEEFPILIRCSSTYKPDVIYASSLKVDDEEAVYPGRWARVSVRPYAWEHPANGKGVSLGLQNVQLLDDAERFAGGRQKAEDEFTPVEVTGAGASADSVFS